MATIYIDNEAYEANSDKNLLETCLSHGFDVPYFCWHPEMGSVGACRQCAVKQYKDENDTQGKIVMSCMIGADDQSRISVEDSEAVQFRKNIIEGLMTNHPHDCPTCDEGGECHLQDMTVMAGHNYRRHRFNKRTFRNQYLGPFINHEMNRCIQCYRCVRFYRDYAGGHDLGDFASKNYVYFGRFQDGTLENEFSGNLVEVCPTGVFTDKTLKGHYTRKWDMTMSPNICQGCSLGCNIIPGERYGKLRRVSTRYNGEVNGYFICDRGRYGYEYVNSEDRVREPVLKKGNEHQPVEKEEAVSVISEAINNSNGIVGIGSPRGSLESNYALQSLVGADNFYQGISSHQKHLADTARNVLEEGPARSPSLNDVKKADAVLVLGEDVTNTAPMMALNLRQSVRNQPMEQLEGQGIPEWHDAAIRNALQDEKGPLYIAAPSTTKLSEVAQKTMEAKPDGVARLGFAIANKLNGQAPAVNDLDKEADQLASEIADELKNAKRPLVVSGTGCGSAEVIKASANVAWALCGEEFEAELSLTVPESNSMGLSFLGGKSLDEAFNKITNGEADTAIIVENDLYRRKSKKQVDDALSKCKNVITLDHLANETVKSSTHILSAGTFAESDGTLINNEGRAQRYYQTFVPRWGTIHESWRWIREVGVRCGNEEMEEWQGLDDYVYSLVEAYPNLKKVKDIAPPAGFRMSGQKMPRQPHRYSGRTAMYAHEDVNEQQPPDDPDSPLSFSMEGFRGGDRPSTDISFFWSAGWNSIQSVNKFQNEVGGSLHGGDPGSRLIESKDVTQPSFFTEVPASSNGQLQAVPFHHIFGSEEHSVHTPAVQERMPSSYVALNNDDAEQNGIQDGAELTITVGDQQLTLPVQVSNTVAKGVVGIPLGLPSLPDHIELPQEAQIKQGGSNG